MEKFLIDIARNPDSHSAAAINRRVRQHERGSAGVFLPINSGAIGYRGSGASVGIADRDDDIAAKIMGSILGGIIGGFKGGILAGVDGAIVGTIIGAALGFMFGGSMVGHMGGEFDGDGDGDGGGE